MTSFRFSSNRAIFIGAVSLIIGLGCGEEKPESTPPQCTPGSQGCTCQGDACDDGLVCETGTCVEKEPDECKAGELGCDCDGGQCEEGAICNAENVCEDDPDCAPGSEGCACIDPDSTCDADLSCVDGLCVTTVAVGLGVGPEVRACDIVLDAGTAASVDFGDEVIGRSRAVGTKVAISFTARDDGSLNGSFLRLNFAREVPVEPGEVNITRATCFDLRGVEIDTPSITLDLLGGQL